MKKMFCASCDKIVTEATFQFDDLDCEVVLKANRLISTGRAMETKGTLVDLDSAIKVEINKILSDVIVTENMDGDVVCPSCREGILITGAEFADPESRESKEDKLRRVGFGTETLNALGALTPDLIRRQIQSLDKQIQEEKALSIDSITTQFKINRYYISVDSGATWKEVSLSSYATAERKAGHIPDMSTGPIASDSFDQDGVMGKVVTFKEKK